VSGDNSPVDIWLDERIARGLPRVKDAELAERGVDQVHYIREDEVKELIRRQGLPDEVLFQIVAGEGGRLYGLSNLGKVYGLGSEGWEEVAEGLDP